MPDFYDELFEPLGELDVLSGTITAKPGIFGGLDVTPGKIDPAYTDEGGLDLEALKEKTNAFFFEPEFAESRVKAATQGAALDAVGEWFSRGTLVIVGIVFVAAGLLLFRSG